MNTSVGTNWRGQRFESRTILRFFRLSFHNCKSCIYNCDDLLSYNSSPRISHVWFSLFITWSSSFHGFITNQFNDLFPVGLLAQLVERCTGMAEVKGSNPVQAWIFPGFLFATAKVASITAMIFFHLNWISYACFFLQKHLWRQNHNDKPVRVSRIFSRPGSVKSWVPNFKLKTYSKLILTTGRVIEKINKENKNKVVNYICPIFRF